MAANIPKLPDNWAEMSKREKVAYFKKRKSEFDKAKVANPLGFYKPLPTAKLFHECTSRRRLCTGGNRSSKTYSGAVEAGYWLRGDSPYREIPKGPLQGVISSLAFDLQRDSILPIMYELFPKDVFEVVWNTQDKHIRGPNGMAWFKSNEQGWESYQSRALDFFWLDEEHSLEVWRQLSKRLKGGSELNSWYTMTPEPDRPDHWTYDELFQPSQDPANADGYAHFAYDLEDNRVSRGGHITDKLIDELIKETPVEHRPAVIHGIYVKRGGLIYPSWDRKVHVAEERTMADFLRATQEGVYTAYCSLDWGIRNPTSIGLWLVDKEENVQRIAEIYQPAANTDEIKRLYNKHFAVFHPQDVFADPTIWYSEKSTNDPTKTIGYKLEQDDANAKLRGLPLVPAENDHMSGFAACRDLLRNDPKYGPKLKVQPRCTDFIREIEAYVGEEWVTNANSRNKKETAVKKNDHAMDEFRYLATAPYRHIPMRRHGAQPAMHISEVTGYMRPA